MPDETSPPPAAANAITEEVQTGLLAVSQGGRLVPAPPGMKHTSVIRARPDIEYVAGGSYNWTASYLRALPFYVDDVTRDFGDDLYERMLLDGKVASCIHTLKMGVLAQGVSLVPAATRGDPAHSRAIELCDFCKRNLDNMIDPLDTVLYDLLDCAAFGNRVAEQIYALEGGQLVLKTLKPKPRRSVAFVVDVYTNVVGMLGLVPGQGAPILVDGMIGSPDQIPNLLPRAKFAVATFRRKDGDPRGQSILRPAYNAWNIKSQLWGQYLKYLTQFASPSVVGVTPEQAEESPQLDSNGNVVLDDNGNPVLVSPEQLLLTALLQFQNGTAAAFPHGTSVQPFQMQGDGQAFLRAFELLNREIEQAVTGQALATSEGEHQSRAASEVHQDILGLLIAHGKTTIAEMLRTDVLRPLVRYNFGPDAETLAPAVSLSETESHDFAQNATAVGALYQAGYLSPSQLVETDAMLGLPIRTEGGVQPLA
jgi:hypothetical protein